MITIEKIEAMSDAERRSMVRDFESKIRSLSIEMQGGPYDVFTAERVWEIWMLMDDHVRLLNGRDMRAVEEMRSELEESIGRLGASLKDLEGLVHGS